VTEINAPTSVTTRASTAARIGWGILILATVYVCYFSHLGAIGFVGPDEPRYAWIARGMVESGDWVTPRLYGKPWFEKPVLYYWGAALCFKLLGVSEAAARLPSAISSLLATLALAWLALRLYGAETARWLLLLLPTTVGMIGFSHAAAPDMPFSGMLTSAMVCAAVVLGFTRNENTPILPRTPWLALLLFGLFLGLAVLAKGPAAIILTGGAIFFWALFTKRWRDAFRLFHPVAIASFCLTALPWYILCARRNPDFFRIFIIEHNFKRYLTPEFQHIQPFWFYVPVLLIAFLPWTALLLWSSIACAIHVARARRVRASTLFLITWTAFCILFFSISQSKLPGYILPAIPAIGLLLAHDLSCRLQSKGASIRLLCLSIAASLLALGFVVDLLSEKIPFVTDLRPPESITAFAGLMSLGATVVVILSLLRRNHAAAAMATTALLLPIFFTFGPDDLWQLDAGVSARRASQEAMDYLLAPAVQQATSYKLSRGLKHGLEFYLRREVNEWDPSASHGTVIFTTHRGSAELQKLGISCSVYGAYPAVQFCGITDAVRKLPNGSPDSGQPH
jgi:4-amino-4-deoxy-L-arabinose transferase-like glycosyltransferase